MKVKQHTSPTFFPSLASLFLSQLLHLLPYGQCWQDGEWGLGSTAFWVQLLLPLHIFFWLLWILPTDISPSENVQLLWHGYSMVCRGITALLWSPPEAAEECLSAPVFGSLPPPPSSLTLVSTGLFPKCFSTPLTALQCFPLSAMCLSGGATTLGRSCGAQLYPAVGLLELPGTGCVQHGTAPAISHKSHLCSPLL